MIGRFSAWMGNAVFGLLVLLALFTVFGLLHLSGTVIVYVLVIGFLGYKFFKAVAEEGQ